MSVVGRGTAQRAVPARGWPVGLFLFFPAVGFVTLAAMNDLSRLTRVQLMDLVRDLQKKLMLDTAQETEHRETRSALRDSAERLRAILETAVEGIITIDDRGIIESFNHSAERIFGYRAGETIGQNVKMLMPEPFRHEHDSYIKNYRETGHAKIIGIGREVIGRRKDGTIFPMDLSVSEVKLADRRMFTGFVRDISERKRLEREIIEISNREQQRIGQDLHDGLCQELTGIELMCQVLEKKLAAKSKAEARQVGELGEHIRQAIAHTRKLARGLFPVELETNGFISALHELADHAGKLFNVECRFECDGLVSIRDNVAATHLYRIAQEAINNAARHGRARRIIVSLKPVGEKVALTVADDGAGFSTQSQQGPGMGLYTMKYRAGVVGATLQIQSNHGKGAVVTCIFDRNL